MKHLLSIAALLVILFSCKKEITSTTNNNKLVSHIKIQLEESLPVNDFQQLDFDNLVISKYKKMGQEFIQIPFIGKNIENDFVLLKMDKNQFFSAGKIVNIKRDNETYDPKTTLSFNGHIAMYSLNKTELIKSSIVDGYVTGFHKTIDKPSAKENADGFVPLMPEVVVTASYPPSGTGWTYTSWMNFVSLFETTDISGGGSGGYYSYIGGGGGGTPTEDAPIFIDFENVESLAPIDVNQYIKCFTNIPDAGANCSISILSDIPVDTDPNKFFDWEKESPGHVFLQITKTNGTQRVSQNIGFYPAERWKVMMTPAPVKGKFADNGIHEYNAALSMKITPEELQSVLTKISSLARFVNYDIDNYNCTDWALEVFNRVRPSNKLVIPLYDIPGGQAPLGTATPQGLYNKLNSMKKNGDAEAGNIEIPGEKKYSGQSKGPCN